ncbi:hypothetical protein PYCCODRAFT_155375 [Trametes coccinea BRFM310]|uniref:Uncharacterized protein n=1 Tax=Trametes coccinea (strain BRFM310) TaxID=1353009 RepID=A0A1Y2I775_TRAC3|nr:hypothetical protein PYCCODRAFT_155375 [Trametes coccinea BRFM310]
MPLLRNASAVTYARRRCLLLLHPGSSARVPASLGRRANTVGMRRRFLRQVLCVVWLASESWSAPSSGGRAAGEDATHFLDPIVFHARHTVGVRAYVNRVAHA